MEYSGRNGMPDFSFIGNIMLKIRLLSGCLFLLVSVRLSAQTLPLIPPAPDSIHVDTAKYLDLSRLEFVIENR